MENFLAKAFILGLFSLVFCSCDNDGPTGGAPAGKFEGVWGKCVDSVNCESVRDNGYRITADSIGQIELSGFENTEYQSADCAKCAKTNFTSWTYEFDRMYKYSVQGDSIVFDVGGGAEITIVFLNTGKIVKNTQQITGIGVNTVLTEYWTRLSGTFTLLN